MICTVPAGGIAEQTEQTLKNLTAILKEAGVGLNNIVKATRKFPMMASHHFKNVPDLSDIDPFSLH